MHAAGLHATGSILRRNPGELLGRSDVRLSAVVDLQCAERSIRRRLCVRDQPPGDVRLRVACPALRTS
jgi:hypothetical protein